MDITVPFTYRTGIDKGLRSLGTPKVLIRLMELKLPERSSLLRTNVTFYFLSLTFFFLQAGFRQPASWFPDYGQSFLCSVHHNSIILRPCGWWGAEKQNSGGGPAGIEAEVVSMLVFAYRENRRVGLDNVSSFCL